MCGGLYSYLARNAAVQHGLGYIFLYMDWSGLRKTLFGSMIRG